jgi:O-antigen ligase
VGFAMAAAGIALLGLGRSRVYMAALGAALLAVLLVAAQGELPIPGGARLHGLWLAIDSGANFETDPDAQFRFRRWESTIGVWETSPLFGVGFGAPIMLDTWGLGTEFKTAKAKGSLGAFNIGMPHNSYLMAMARTGLIGLGLICFAWFSGIFKVGKLAMRGVADADQIACAAALVAMISTCGLNLFFERPMLCAPFWILVAANYKLSETVPRKMGTALRRTGTRRVVPSVSQRGNLRPDIIQEHDQAGWQARWK